MPIFGIFELRLSNEQRISSPFGARNFVTRQDEQTLFANRGREALKNSHAIPQKNNEA